MAKRGRAGLIAAAAAAVIVAGVLALPGPTPPVTSAPVTTLSPPRPTPRAVVPTGSAAPVDGVVDPTAVVITPEPAGNGTDTGGEGVVHMMDQVEIAPLGRGWTSWQTVGTTAGEGSTPGASCEVTSLATLGASNVARRDFAGPGARSDATAGQVIGSFDSVPDAQRAYRAMQSWRVSCASQMQRQGYNTATVGDFVRLDSKADSAGWWSGRFTQQGTPSDTTWTAFTGIAVSGSTVTVVWIETGDAVWAAAGATAIAATLRQSTELVRTSIR